MTAMMTWYILSIRSLKSTATLSLWTKDIIRQFTIPHLPKLTLNNYLLAFIVKDLLITRWKGRGMMIACSTLSMKSNRSKLCLIKLRTVSALNPHLRRPALSLSKSLLSHDVEFNPFKSLSMIVTNWILTTIKPNKHTTIILTLNISSNQQLSKVVYKIVHSTTHTRATHITYRQSLSSSSKVITIGKATPWVGNRTKEEIFQESTIKAMTLKEWVSIDLCKLSNRLNSIDDQLNS